MNPSRREFALQAGLAAAAAAADVKAAASRPTLCIFSKHLAKLQYVDLGPVVKQLGFDGVDLTVRAAGHVLPEKVPVDLTRAIESIRAEGLEVPMITTGLVSPMDPTANNTLGIAGRINVRCFKPGYWRYTPGENIEARLMQVKRDLLGLVALGRHYGIACGMHNHSGDNVGAAVWDTRAIVQDIDPRWMGYYFDPMHATVEGGMSGWRIALEMALPRVKMVAVKDFYWEKTGGKWKTRNCPLGQGMVDWQQFFRILARARFAGPVSMHIEYNPADELSAMATDLEFLKKQVAAAYGS
jgi:sugar phosphate isomerase/epimerase